MQGNNLFNNGLLQPKKPPIGQEQQKMTRYHQLRLVFGLVGVLLYPFAILGSIPLLIGLAVDKRDKAANVFDMDYESFLKRNSIVFLSFSAVLFVINVFAFILWIPRGYLSAYLLFPLNLLHTALRFNWETIVALLIGSSGMGAIFLAFSSFVAKRKVISKEDERKKITESKAYKDREKNKFEESQRFTDEQEEAYEEAVETVDIDKYKELSNQLLLGTSEFGLPYIINFSEFNQHVLVPATTGSGKTTLCNLLPRFYEVTEGAITIDGINIQEMTLASLRQQIGTVQQDVFLFPGTIRENIAYGKLDATEEEILKAVKLAHLEKVIDQMTDGLDTVIGERGVKLSGGQKQRVAIARMFLKNPPILILDEATSALDTETEQVIQESLNSLADGRTTLIIAHRLATIKHATRIIVVSEKGILEEGTHEELMARKGHYRALHDAQFARDREPTLA